MITTSLVLAAAMTAQQIVAVQVGTFQSDDSNAPFYCPLRPTVDCTINIPTVDPLYPNDTYLVPTLYKVPKTQPDRGKPYIYPPVYNAETKTWSQPWTGKPIYAYYQANGLAKAFEVMGIAPRSFVRVRK